MADNPFSLNSKTILITGATSGIGRACALQYAKDGAIIVATGRDQSKLDSLKSEIENPQNHIYIQADLTSKEGLDFLMANMPELNGVVFAAGVAFMKPLKFVSDEDIDYVLNSNLISTIKLTRNLLKKRKLQKFASIVYIASIAGVIAKPAQSIYAITKAGMIRFAQDMAIENAAMKMRFNSVSFSMIETPMTKDFIENDTELYQADLKRYILGYGKTDDAANSIQFLLSDASKWVTGSNMIVDGGYTCQK